MVKTTIEIIGDQDAVIEFISLCGKIQALGRWGASRVIPVDVDGDGSARLSFSIPYKDSETGKKGDHIKDWFSEVGQSFKEEVDDKIKTHYIGE